MAFYTVTDTDLISIANTIREKTGGAAKIVYPSGFVDSLDNISDVVIEGSEYDQLIGLQSSLVPFVNSEVKKIGSYIFRSWSWTAVSIDACEEIGDYAFATCKSISEIYAPNVKSIGMQAFGQCSSLSAVDLPSCEYIGSSAFYNCMSIRSLSLPVCKSIAFYAFYRASIPVLDLPECEYIGPGAFSSCYVLQSASLPKCSCIEMYAFQNCTNLKSVYMVNCEYIGDRAFSGTSISGEISLSKCSGVGTGAFYNTRITSVSLPVCTHIGLYAFYSCSLLANAYLPQCSTIGRSAFMNTRLTSIDLPECTTMQDEAFKGCSYLAHVNIGSKCRSIPSSAFQNCNLSSIYLSSISYLGGCAFCQNYDLSIISIHLNYCSIGKYAFSGVGNGLTDGVDIAYFDVTDAHVYSHAFRNAKINKLIFSAHEGGVMGLGFWPSAFYGAVISSLYMYGYYVTMLYEGSFDKVFNGGASIGAIYVPEYIYSAYVDPECPWYVYSSRIFSVPFDD